MTRPVYPTPSCQRGASLVVVLILLLVMTLLGLAVLRTTLLDERMSANLRDRSLALQALVASLRPPIQTRPRSTLKAIISTPRPAPRKTRGAHCKWRMCRLSPRSSRSTT